MYWVPVLPSYGSQSVAFLWRPVGWFAERGRLTGFYMGAALALNGLIFVQMLVIKKLVLVFVFSWTFDCCQFSTAFPLHFAYLLLGAGGCFAGCVCVCVCVCVCGGGGRGWRRGWVSGWLLDWGIVTNFLNCYLFTSYLLNANRILFMQNRALLVVNQSYTKMLHCFIILLPRLMLSSWLAITKPH